MAWRGWSWLGRGWSTDWNSIVGIIVKDNILGVLKSTVHIESTLFIGQQEVRDASLRTEFKVNTNLKDPRSQSDHGEFKVGANLEDPEVKMTISVCLTNVARKLRFAVRNGSGKSEPMSEPSERQRTANLIPVRSAQNAEPWTEPRTNLTIGQQLRPGVPPLLTFVGMTNFSIRSVINVIDHGFSDVRLVRIDESLCSIIRLDDGSIETEQWSYRRIKYRTAVWLESLGCEDAIRHLARV
ncbi:hypothetical protein DFJ58DRAFT_847430 [Suillus subalutaceus]|uniref:uncharacterized protein n=1 Tax=Suillus subalutaceus TaxID=48586 RepID=UPI001B88069D|nr:uncharacterized protein DFJ58DRAFT_847430 [Suillus subalutaceus]KAG1835382.1 hypothetical protein DFJ58DRAFT_847430 [Suillus subalutaceus]